MAGGGGEGKGGGPPWLVRWRRARKQYVGSISYFQLKAVVCSSMQSVAHGHRRRRWLAHAKAECDAVNVKLQHNAKHACKRRAQQLRLGAVDGTGLRWLVRNVSEWLRGGVILCKRLT